MQNPVNNSVENYYTQKLHTVLALQGLGSRRVVEQWIKEGRILVNGKVASLGLRVSHQDTIHLNGKPLVRENVEMTVQNRKVLLYYKASHEICTERDPEARKTVFEKLPVIHPKRWLMVGRLDYNTQGLLLFTTDGLLSHRLLHPSYAIEREYAVRIYGSVTQAMLNRLKKGIYLDGSYARFISIEPKSTQNGVNNWYHVILTEGKKGEVRRLWASQGVTVSRLIRVRFGPIVLPQTLKKGQYIELPPSDIQKLINCVQEKSVEGHANLV